MSTFEGNSRYTRAGEWPIRRYTPPLKRAPRPGVYIEQTSTETFDLARIYTRIHDPRGGISSSELHLHIEGVPTVHHGQSRVSRAVGVLCRWLCWSVLRLNWCCPSFLHFKEPATRFRATRFRNQVLRADQNAPRQCRGDQNSEGVWKKGLCAAPS